MFMLEQGSTPQGFDTKSGIVLRTVYFWNANQKQEYNISCDV